MDDYGYINARVRALRADLLDKQDYEQLLGLPNVSSVREYLGRTVYGKRLGAIPTGASIGMLEEWLRQEWSDALTKIHRITDGRPREHLEILLGRWDLENLKAILRGRRAGMGLPEILATALPTGILDETALAELARQPSIQAIADLLTTWRSPYARPLKQALRIHRELKGLEPVELALDRNYFEGAVRRLKGGDHNAQLLHELIGLLIDKVNLLTAFKISMEGIASRSEALSYFIEGGSHLPVSVYSDLIRARGLREIAEVILKTPYAEILKGLEREQGGIPPSVRLERGMERFILDRTRRMGLSDSLGIGLMVGYLLKKYHEVCNLRIILRGKAYDMYPEDMRALLVM